MHRVYCRSHATGPPNLPDHPQFFGRNEYLESGNYLAAVDSLRKATALNPKHAAAQLKLAEVMLTSQKKETLEDAAKRLQEALAENPNSAAALDTLAVAEATLGKFEDATTLLDQSMEKFPNDLRAAGLLANSKIQQRDFTKAEEILRKAVAGAPKSPDAALMLGRLYLQMNKQSQAEAEIRRALALDPKSAGALLSLAPLQQSTNRRADAEQTLKQLASLPNKEYQPIYGLFLFQQGNRDAALAEFLRLANADPNDRAARTRLIAAYVAMDKIPQAEAVLATALKRNPKDTDALLQRSELRWRSHDIPGAAKDVQEVLNFQPNSAAAHFELAKIDSTQGLTLSVRQELGQSLRLDPHNLWARLALARTFIGANDFNSALNVVNETPQSQKNNLSLSIERNWALLGLGRKEARQEIDRGLNTIRAPELLEQDGFLKMKEGDFAGARRDAEELLARFPEQERESLRAVRLLVDSCDALHQRPKALEELRAVVSQRPKSAQLQTLLGRVLVAFGNRAEARTAFQAAISADPKYLAAKMELAQIEVADNHPDSAQHLLTEVLAADPGNVMARLILADALATEGHRAEAIATFRSVLASDASNVIALTNLANLIIAENSDEALRYAQKAVELAPDDITTQDALGLVYYRKGMYSRAVEHLKMAAAKEPSARQQYHLAMAYLKVGDMDHGQPLLAAALKKDPNLAKTEREW
jgi:tetratricopeptide (TPR) repeat protein